MFNQILKKLREEQGMSQAKLAKMIGVAQSTVGMWESGKNKPEYNTLVKLSEIFDTSIDYLTGNKTSYDYNNGKLNNIFPLPFSNKKTVPLIGTIACGQPILANESKENDIELPDNISADFCLRCKGNSMINARIYDGDIVFIRSQSQVENGEIAAVVINDTADMAEATLKRVYVYKNKVVLSAENPEYEPIVYIGEEMNYVRIIGKAVAFISSIK